MPDEVWCAPELSALPPGSIVTWLRKSRFDPDSPGIQVAGVFDGHGITTTFGAQQELGSRELNICYPVRVVELGPKVTPKPEPCKGFQWVGQSFANCNECGEPFWEHTHDARLKPGAGPFDDDGFEYVPIADAVKAAVKANWGPRKTFDVGTLSRCYRCGASDGVRKAVGDGGYVWACPDCPHPAD